MADPDHDPHGFKRRGVLFVLSSPSGAGKSTIARKLLAADLDLVMSVSATTRPIRPGEVDGVDYHFVDLEKFRDMVANHEFLEWAHVFGHRYGTPHAHVDAMLAAGKDVLFDIDWQGAMSVTAQAPADVVRVFVLPPSMADLRRRLYARAQDGAAVIERRLMRAYGEIRMWAEYDYVIVNDDFDAAYAELAHIYHAERLRRSRNPWLRPMVEDLLEQQA